MALADNLVAYWKMDEASGNRSDSVGSHTLTDVNTVASATGKISNGADFEKDNSEYLYNSSSDFHLTGESLFTVSAWFKLESTPAASAIAVVVANRKTDNSVGDCFKIYIDGYNSGQLTFQTWASTGSFLTMGTGIYPTTGRWYHVMFVKAATNDWKCYVNGRLAVSSTSTRSNSTTNLAGISIGAEDQGSSGISGYFDGIIDEFGVWSRALSASEVSQIFNSGRGNAYSFTATPNLYGGVSFWKLDENSGNATDIISINDLTLGGSPSYTTGKINNGLDLESSSSQYAYITDSNQKGLDVTDYITIVAWIKIESLPSSSAKNFIVSKENTTSSNRQYEFAIRENSGNYQLLFGVGISDGTNMGFYSANHSFATATWYHVAAVYVKSTNTVYFYVNGSLISNGTLDATGALPDGNGTFNLGARLNTQQDFFDGIIDEVGIWDRDLSSTEISLLYASGNGLAYPWSVTTNTSTVSSKARVKVTDNSKTIQAKSRIKVVDNSKTASAKARIKKLQSSTVSAKASISTAATKTVSAKANVKNTTNKTVQAKADIKNEVSSTVSGKAAIKTGYTKTASSKARILKVQTKTAASKARILNSQITKTVTSKARVKKLQTQTISARSRISSNLTKTVSAKARVKTQEIGILRGVHKNTNVLIGTRK